MQQWLLFNIYILDGHGGIGISAGDQLWAILSF